MKSGSAGLGRITLGCHVSEMRGLCNVIFLSSDDILGLLILGFFLRRAGWDAIVTFRTDSLTVASLSVHWSS